MFSVKADVIKKDTKIENNGVASLVTIPIHLEIYEPVSVKTRLNDIEMKIQITALRESIDFSECLLKF